ncbi:MAG: glycoside hydrolase family 140 protein [Bacteroidota bacterium]
MLLLSATCQAQSIRIGENGRHLIQANGEDFLWLGDTAWELFHRLDKAEADHYLQTRAEQGFTVVQAVILAELDGLRTPNANGDRPFYDLDPTRPNEAYFEFVDYVVATANSLGLTMVLLPTWGDKLPSDHPAAGPIVFNSENAYSYGEFLGKRYQNAAVIWMLGGDRKIVSPEVLEIWRSMAAGLASGDGGRHLMSFHPRGEHSSSYWLHNESWLDFNAFQTGHARHFNSVYDWVTADYLRHPIKPTIDAEPAYEGIPVRFWEFIDFADPQKVPEGVLDEKGLVKDSSHFAKGFFDDYDVRIHAYWNLLSGAAGYTYGNNAVWQMYQPGYSLIIPALQDWRAALRSPGAEDIRWLNELFTRFPLSRLQPDQSLVYGPNRAGEDHIRSAIDRTGEFALFYLSQGQELTAVLGKLKGENLSYSWFNPRDGSVLTGEVIPNQGHYSFASPSSGAGQDWLLILQRQ